MDETRVPDVRFVPTPQIRGYLERMVELGIYGRTVSEVARRLVCEGIEHRLKAGLFAEE